jgi:hypothetical protein
MRRGGVLQSLTTSAGLSSAAAQTVQCGQVLASSIVLASDLTNCRGDGLVIGANGITVDLNGKTVDGIGLGVGIRNDGFDEVTIRNGTAQEFDYGVVLNAGARKNVVEYLTLTQNEFAGVWPSDNDENLVRENVVERQANEGIRPGGGLGDGNAVVGNHVEFNSGLGLLLESSAGTGSSRTSSRTTATAASSSLRARPTRLSRTSSARTRTVGWNLLRARLATVSS